MSFAPSFYSVSYYVGIRHLGWELNSVFEEGTFYIDSETGLEIGVENDSFLAAATYDPFFAV